MPYTFAISDQGAVYFITCTISKWVDVFIRKIYADIIVQSLNYCIQNKGLTVFGYVIMSNHIHLLVQAKNNNLSDVLRDFKKYTSQTIISAIENNPKESRKNWMLWLFKDEKKGDQIEISYRFWQPDNHAEICFSLPFSWQKLNYIHNNPVRANVVNNPQDYKYSSAGDYFAGKQMGGVSIDFLNSLTITVS